MATLFTVAKKQKQPKYPCTDEQMSRMRYTVHSGVSLNSKKEILTHDTIWMNFENAAK
jgi:hypothetical protein